MLHGDRIKYLGVMSLHRCHPKNWISPVFEGRLKYTVFWWPTKKLEQALSYKTVPVQVSVHASCARSGN